MMRVLFGDENLGLSSPDNRGCTPLIYSVSKGQANLVKVLLGQPRPTWRLGMLETERLFGMPCDWEMKTSLSN
jgi:hypothetical protein